MTEKYERQMKKGILDLLVLKLLNRQPKYGYQLISELRDQSDGIFCAERRDTVSDFIPAGGRRIDREQME